MEELTHSYIILALALLPFGVYIAMAAIFTGSIIYGRCKLHRLSKPTLPLKELPGVSILKPLMGVDAFLETNLESYFTLNYPKYELLMCLEDPEDPAIVLVHKLMDRYPGVDCKVFTGGKYGHIKNPMVRNMAPGYKAAKYPIVWVSTSRILANTDMLVDMVAKYDDPKVVIVHQLPYTTDQPSLAAAVEKVYFGAATSRFVMGSDVLRYRVYTGMSYLIKKDELDNIGGLEPYGKFLAEDFFIAKTLYEKGLRLQLAAIPAQQNVASTSIDDFKDRMVRWLRLRLNMMPWTGAFLEPITQSVLLGVYASWAAGYLFGYNPYLWFCVHWSIWCLLDYIQLTGVQNGPLPFSKSTFVLAWFVLEVLYIFIFVEAVINPRVVRWGKQTYRMSNLGRTLEVYSGKSSLLLTLLVIIFVLCLLL